MKIVALNGLLGYGYSEEALKIAFSEKVDYLGVDAGSTDPGPYYLGSGKSFTDRSAVKRDLSLALPLALSHKAPFIIGTAGGAGSCEHVRWVEEIIRELASEKKLSCVFVSSCVLRVFSWLAKAVMQNRLHITVKIKINVSNLFIFFSLKNTCFVYPFFKLFVFCLESAVLAFKNPKPFRKFSYKVKIGVNL